MAYYTREPGLFWVGHISKTTALIAAESITKGRRIIKRLVFIVAMVMLAVVIGFIIARAGEKEELTSKLQALIQEERAMNAEFQLYQVKIRQIQERFPEMKKEQTEVQNKLKILEEQAKKKESK